jgi:plastocyanin
VGELYYDGGNQTLRLFLDSNGTDQIIATRSWVTAQISEVDLTGLATEDYVDTAIDNIEIPEVDLTGLATEDYVDTALNNLEGASIEVSATAPVAPQEGNVWLNTTNGYLYIYINDGNSSQWIQPASPAGAQGIQGIQGEQGPAGPTGSGAGDVASLAAPVTNNAIVRYHEATGTIIQNSVVTISDAGAITAPNNTGSMIPFYYETLVSFPSATNSHGAVAHAHDTGKMYYAHAGQWIELANVSDIVGGGGTVTSVGGTGNVNGLTLSGTVTSSGNLTLGGTLAIAATQITSGTLAVARGGTGTATPGLVEGTNITISGTWPNQTINATSVEGTTSNSFATISVAGQSNVIADSSTDTLTLVAGSNITITTDATTDTITIAAGGGGTASDSFATISVAGQDSVVADSSTDTLTLAAGTGISITTNAGTDTVTITNTASAGATAFTDLSDAGTLTVDKFYLPAITMLDVTANGTTAYRFDQYGTTDDPTIFAINATTIAFNLAGASGHPFLIQDNTGTNYNIGLTHVTTAGVVTTGASAQAKSSGTLYWKIPDSISGNYRYQCASHAGMVGTITIKNFGTI